MTATTINVRARGYEAAAVKAFEQAGLSLDSTLVFSHVRRGGSNISARTWSNQPVYHRFTDTHVSTLVREDTHADIARASVRRNEDRSYSVDLEMIVAPVQADPEIAAILAREAQKTPEARAAENPLNGSYENTVSASDHDAAINRMMLDLGVVAESPREFEETAPGNRIYSGTVTNAAGEQAPYRAEVHPWDADNYYLFFELWPHVTADTEQAAIQEERIAAATAGLADVLADLGLED